jgi:putative hydrolase of HD superfamily
MAVLLRHEFPEVDFSKLIRICVVHDLGEAVAGDVPAVDQEAAAPKAAQGRLDLLDILAPLPGGLRAELVSLRDDYESAYLGRGTTGEGDGQARDDHAAQPGPESGKLR